MDLDEVINELNNGMYTNIAKQGSAKCFSVSDDYVLVIRKFGTDSSINLEDTLKNFSQNNDTKCVCTVVDYKIVEDVVYELQKKGKGEHFRIDETKETTLSLIEDTQINLSLAPDGVKKVYEKSIKKWEDYTKTEKFKNLLDTFKDEIMRRLSIIQEMPEQHITDFFESVLIIHENNLSYDSSGNNVLYDSENGFSIIDLQCDKGYVNIENMLNSDNYQTISTLLGMDRIKLVGEDEKTEVIEEMREALKKICVALFDFKYNGKTMTKDIMEKSLSTYRKYGIELTYDEIEDAVQKSSKGKNITLADAAKNALKQGTTPFKADEAKGVEQTALNPENIKEGETKDD